MLNFKNVDCLKNKMLSLYSHQTNANKKVEKNSKGTLSLKPFKKIKIGMKVKKMIFRNTNLK